MRKSADFTANLEKQVANQFKSQRVGYLLGAGSSYLNGTGYPLAFQLWDKIKDRIPDAVRRKDIQDKLDSGARGIEHALDLLDDGGATDTIYRHMVVDAIADLFKSIAPPLDLHGKFVSRIAQQAVPSIKVFSLNYDPLIERAAEMMRVRLIDGFFGFERCYFAPTAFEERIGRLRGTHRGRQFEEAVKPIHLLKLHGSLGWYESPTDGTRRCGFSEEPPVNTKRLMIPPQRRKASDTMNMPYSALWSEFRGSLSQNAVPINRLVCIGYGFGDEHVNSIIEAALGRRDFTVLIFARDLADSVWNRWSVKTNVVVVTENRCALKGAEGAGHADLWRFERLAEEV